MSITLGSARVRPAVGSHAWRGIDQTWPVLRDKCDTGAFVLETERGYRFEVPADATADGVAHRGKERPFRESAREDAEEWFKNKGEQVQVKVTVLAATDDKPQRYRVSSPDGTLDIPSPYNTPITPEIQAEIDRLGLSGMEGRDGAVYAVTRLHPGAVPVWTGDIANGWTFRV